MIDEPDAALVSRALSGNDLAIQSLLLRYHDRIAAAIAPKVPAELRPVLAAEDICQEAYVAAVRELGSFQPETGESFYRWVLTIAERKLVDSVRMMRALKRGGRHYTLGLPGGNDTSSVVALLDLVAVHERTPSRSAVRREIVLAVEDALRDLSDDYQTVLRLRYLEGLPLADTAQRMGRSAKAVSTLCGRALSRLAEIIGDPSRFFSETA